MRRIARLPSRDIDVEVVRRAGAYAVRIDKEEHVVRARRDGVFLLLDLEGRAVECVVGRVAAGRAPGERLWDVSVAGRLYAAVLADPLRATAAAAAAGVAGPIEVRALMPGRIAAILAQPGQSVSAGQGVVVVEAMKMENEAQAPKAGTIRAVHVAVGATVDAGAPLFTVE